MNEPVHVLIADDHPLFRTGLRLALDHTDGIEVVGEATTGAQAVQLCAELQPDIVVMDLDLPELHGVEATRCVVQDSPDVRVLVLTMFDDDDSVFAAMRAGARGYLLKGADQADIARAIQASTEDVRDRTAAVRFGITATALAIVGLASSYLVQGVLDVEPGYDVRGFLIGTTVALALAGVLFGKVVPGALRSTDGSNRPATVGLITSVFAFLGIALFWLGVPLVAAGASIALARSGQERARRSGGGRRANAALAISVLVVLATVAVLVNDVLGHFDMGIQPPAE